MRAITITTLFLVLTASVQANMQITEYMYSGALVPAGTGVDGEFIEFTNIGGPAVNMTGYSFDDSTRVAGSFSLSAFGTVQPGESVILCQALAADFKTAWGLGASVKVIGANDQNLGRADEINIYDNTNALVDRLTYDDQTISGTIRTQFKSGWTPASNLGPFTINNQWVLSSVGDAQNSYTSTGGDIANPGTYVPEPATLSLLLVGSVLLAPRRGGFVR